MKKLRLINFVPLMITIPSITIGAIAMCHNKVSSSIWIQNIVCLVIAGLISCFAVSNKFIIIRIKTIGFLY